MIRFRHHVAAPGLLAGTPAARHHLPTMAKADATSVDQYIASQPAATAVRHRGAIAGRSGTDAGMTPNQETL
jgi:hypothetical protein